MICAESVRVGNVELSLETGRVARQAGGAVVVRAGKAFVLGTVVSEAGAGGSTPFFPLTVEYREMMAASGRIPGGYGRREGRQSSDEVLSSRMIDRSLRPLFAAGFRAETQVQATVFSHDPDVDPTSLGLIAAAAAVHLSDLPFDGPVAGLRIAGRGQSNAPLPDRSTAASAEWALMVSATRAGMVMVEGGARELDEVDLLAAFDAATDALGPLLDAMDRLRAAAGRPKRVFAPLAKSGELRDAVDAHARDSVAAALQVHDKQARSAALATAREACVVALGQRFDRNAVRDGFDGVAHDATRTAVLDGRRIGGRGPTDIREIDGEVGLLPNAHGSALFTRGETQALVTATLGTHRDALEEMGLDGQMRTPFFLHYNFPSYSVGEVRQSRGPGRREIGHGRLAERALAAVLPAASAFPYAVRVVSDITESNGSSSMASVCGGSLALMDAGVPIRAPVAGIAMGLVREGDRIAIISDILGDEDHCGDMDFKVAGTVDGVTAVQLDNKIGSLPRDVLARALEQARDGRHHILTRMATILDAPRDGTAEHAPQLARRKVNPARVRRLIGPGGKTIKSLQAQTRTRIAVDADTGEVVIHGTDRPGTVEAARQVERLTLELKLDGLYLATVKSIREHGAVVQIEDHEGLVHVSELGPQRVASVGAVVSAGEEMLVRVLDPDERGRLRLSRKAALGDSRLEALNA